MMDSFYEKEEEFELKVKQFLSMSKIERTSILNNRKQISRAVSWGRWKYWGKEIVFWLFCIGFMMLIGDIIIIIHNFIYKKIRGLPVILFFFIVSSFCIPIYLLMRYSW